MTKSFTLIINAGRSGSTFLAHLLKENFSETCYVAHEDIPVQTSKPRFYNRAYEQDRLSTLLNDKDLMSYIARWKKELSTRNVVETGWTSYHLCPLLRHVFGDQFRYVIMHRDPISFAFSRANMGNYHPDTFYDDAHEVSPFDPFSIAPQKQILWNDMNHFEKCMYWWWVVYLEAYEFREKEPSVPSFEIMSNDVFSFVRFEDLLTFLGLDRSQFCDRSASENALPQFMRETFPVNNAWRPYSRHKDILDFAKHLGYSFDEEQIRSQASKYQLPKGFGSRFRYSIQYWRWKSRIANPIKKLLERTP